MLKTILIGLIFSFLFYNSNLMCQSEVDSSESIKSNINPNPTYLLFRQRLQENLNDYSSLEFGWNSIVLDSLKSIRELLAFNKNNSENFNNNSFVDELLERKYRKLLILKTSQERYKNMPKTQLGVVSKYLGISNRVAAILLAVLSL